jgi:hypothetical protein
MCIRCVLEKGSFCNGFFGFCSSAKAFAKTPSFAYLSVLQLQKPSAKSIRLHRVFAFLQNYMQYSGMQKLFF